MQTMARSGWLLLAVLLLTATGCGTIDADMQFRFTSDSKVGGSVTMKGTGTLGNMLASGDNRFTNFDRAVWDVSRDVKDGVVVLTAATKGPVPIAEHPMFKGSVDPYRNAEWSVGGNPFVRSYRFSLEMKTTPMDPPTQNAFIDAQAMNNLADAAFKMTVAVTMPGRITSHNADNATESTAKWLMTYSGIVAGKALTVESQEVQWATIGGGAFGLVGLVGAGAWLRSRGRRSAPATVTVESEPPEAFGADDPPR